MSKKFTALILVLVLVLSLGIIVHAYPTYPEPKRAPQPPVEDYCDDDCQGEDDNEQ